MVLLAEMRTLKSNKGKHKRKEVLGIIMPYLICIPRVTLRHVAGLLGLLH
jgi:hypothetical protein